MFHGDEVTVLELPDEHPLWAKVAFESERRPGEIHQGYVKRKHLRSLSNLSNLCPTTLDTNHNFDATSHLTNKRIKGVDVWNRRQIGFGVDWCGRRVFTLSDSSGV